MTASVLFALGMVFFIGMAGAAFVWIANEALKKGSAENEERDKKTKVV